MMWNPFKKKITKEEVLVKLEQRERKLRSQYNFLVEKAANARKVNRALESKVYTEAAKKVGKTQTILLQKIIQLKNSEIEEQIHEIIKETAFMMKEAKEVLDDTDDLNLQIVLKEIQNDTVFGSYTGEVLDDTLRATGIRPEEIGNEVEVDIQSRVRNEIPQMETASRLRTKIEQAIRDEEI
jgi:hypothetical protein